MANTILDLKQAASGGCDDKVGGIKKLWIGRVADIASITCTAVVESMVTTGYNLSAITFSATNGLSEYEFSDNKTAFINETQGDQGTPVDIQVSIEYEGLSAQKIYSLNELKKECALIIFAEYKTGIVRVFGIDITVPASNTFIQCTTALRSKAGTQSGVGNNDYEKAVLEFVGQSKYLGMTSSLTPAALNALNFS